MGIKSASLLIAGCVLPAVMAMPEPTPAARLEHRQAASAITQVWSPSIINGMTVTWQSFSFVISSATRTLISSNSNWGWCPTSTSNCPLPTTCSNGTVFFAATSSIACASENPLCGTELLFSTSGANSRLTRHACFPTTDLGRLTSIYLLTPPASQVSGSSSSSSSSSSSQSPSPTPNGDGDSKTNIGAIVGGVVGGLAVLVIAILGIFFLLRHRKKQRSTATAAAATSGPNGTHPSPYGGAAGMAQPHAGGGYYPPGAGSPEAYNAKHASYADYQAGSPPPQYPNSAMGQQNYYPPPGSVTSPHPEAGGYASTGSSPAQHYGAPVTQQQQGAMATGHTSYGGAHELPGQSVLSPTKTGAVELNAEKQ